MTDVFIRPYEQSDWTRIAAIHDAARKIELRLAGLSDAFLPLSVAAERENLFDYTVDVAEINGRVSGFCAYTEDELAWLYVDPALHRNGIATALARHAMRQKPDLRYLEVLKGNEPARRFYETLGFHTQQELSGRMPGNEAFPVTVYCMTKE